MSQHRRDEDELDLEEEEVTKLEKEIEQMAQKVLEYRTTLPDQLTSLIASQRPVLPEADTPMHPGPDTLADVSQGPPREMLALPITEDTEEAEKIELLKQKIASNATMQPIVVLNRMKEYMTRIDKLESLSGIVHPVFKWRRLGPQNSREIVCVDPSVINC